MIPFYVDEDSEGTAVVRGLRGWDLDILTVTEAGNRGASDEEQLKFATKLGRTLFSSNAKDFDRINREWVSVGRHHGGIVVLEPQQTPVGDVIRGLVRLSEALEPPDIADQLIYLRSWILRR